MVNNKIDIDKKCVERKYALGEKIGCPFYLTSAADGTNVVRIFEELIKIGIEHKTNPKKDYADKIFNGAITTPKSFYCSNIKEVQNIVDSLTDENEHYEGFVICDKHFNRIKLN